MGVFAETAPELHARGLNVIPMIPGQKIPARGCRWKVWQTARQTPDDIGNLVRLFPRHDIAVVLGVPSAPLVDIEYDSSEGARWLADSGLPLPETVSFASPRGRHRLYMTPSGPVRTSHPHPKLEVRGRGALAVVPPSRGRVWAFASALNPETPTIPENLLPYRSKGSSMTGGWGAGVASLPPVWHQFLIPAAPIQPSSYPKAMPYGEEDIQAVPLSSGSESLLTALVGSDRRSGEIVLELCRQPDVTQRLLALAWEREARIEENFHCLFVGHGEDRHPSAAIIFDPQSGTFVYHDRHRKSGPPCFTQPEVAAGIQLKEVRKYRRADNVKNGDHSGGAFTAIVCYLGALAQAGMLTLVENPLLPLPSFSPPEARILHTGIGYLYGLRWLLSPGEPIPLAWNFLARVCDLPEKYVALGMHWLRTSGLLMPAGSYTAYGKQVSLWLPGSDVDEEADSERD